MRNGRRFFRSLLRDCRGQSTGHGPGFACWFYGALRRGGSAGQPVGGPTLSPQCGTVPGYALYDLGHYPGLVRQYAAGSVHGELCEVAESLRPELDRVEGAPCLFRLAIVDFEAIDGPAYACLYQRDIGAPQIVAERWDNRRAAPWNGAGP